MSKGVKRVDFSCVNKSRWRVFLSDWFQPFQCQFLVSMEISLQCHRCVQMELGASRVLWERSGLVQNVSCMMSRVAQSVQHCNRCPCWRTIRKSILGLLRLDKREWTGVSINGGTPKWMVYEGKSHSNGWFGCTTIYGNLQLVSEGRKHDCCDTAGFPSGNSSRDVACRWLHGHEDIWKSWLPDPTKCFSGFGLYHQPSSSFVWLSLSKLWDSKNSKRQSEFVVESMDGHPSPGSQRPGEQLVMFAPICTHWTQWMVSPVTQDEATRSHWGDLQSMSIRTGWSRRCFKFDWKFSFSNSILVIVIF